MRLAAAKTSCTCCTDFHKAALVGRSLCCIVILPFEWECWFQDRSGLKFKEDFFWDVGICVCGWNCPYFGKKLVLHCIIPSINNVVILVYLCFTVVFVLGLGLDWECYINLCFFFPIGHLLFVLLRLFGGFWVYRKICIVIDVL